MTTATSSPRPIRAAGPAPGTSKTWFPSRHLLKGNRRKTGSSRPPAPRPRSAPWSAPTVASSPPPNRSQRPPNRPLARDGSLAAPHRSPPRRMAYLPNPSPPIPRPLSFLLAYQGQGVRMQARPRSLPPLSLAAALLGSVRAAARAAGPRHRPDRAARASGDSIRFRIEHFRGSIRPETTGQPLTPRVELAPAPHRERRSDRCASRLAGRSGLGRPGRRSRAGTASFTPPSGAARAHGLRSH